MKAKAIMKRALAIVLVAVMAINFSISAINAEASERGTFVTKTVDGVEYKIHTFIDNGINHVQVYKGDSQDYYEVYLSNDKEQLVQEEYDYKGENFWGQEDYNVDIQVMDLVNSDESNGDVTAQGISWNGKTYDHWKKDYWYKKGNDGSKVYFQIGSVATYQIRVDNNSNNKRTLEKFASAIKSCNQNQALATAAAAGTGVSMGVVMGLVIANAAFPPTIIVDIVVGILGGGAVSSLVKYSVNAYSDYKDIEDIYIDARACGTKIK